MTHVSWNNAKAYVASLNERLGVAAYRLPSEAEWKYARRAGTNTRRWWSDAWDPARANGHFSFEGGRTSPVDLYEENGFKLGDMIGNVWEWCEDAWAEKLDELPDDGRPHNLVLTYPRRAFRGGSWDDVPGDLRSAIRSMLDPDYRNDVVGFRLARTL